jgi:dihydrofolate reductase
MGKVTSQLSISVDGYVAGPRQSMDNPIGEGGMRLHEWAFATAAWRAQQGMTGGEHSADSEVIEDLFRDNGAYVMGRNMFGGGSGPWDESWRGWWGEEPPYRAPVFVLTHHPRAPLEMRGGTVFTFVTDGIESALRQAKAAAGDRDVAIAGGAQTVNQYLAAGLLDELHLHIAPVVLGAGARLFDNVGDPRLEPMAVVASPTVTHISYRVAR